MRTFKLLMLIAGSLASIPIAFSSGQAADDTPERRDAAKAFSLAASNSFAAGNYTAAVSNLTAQLSLYAGDHNAYHNRGRAKYWLHDYAGAVADYDKAILLNASCGGFYCNRGQAKVALGDMAGAIADLDRAIELDPGMGIAYFNRGQAKSCGSQDYIGAIADFTKAIDLHNDPKEEDIYFARGSARMQIKDFAGAVADFTQVVALKPSNAQARTNLVAAQEALRVLSGTP